MKEVSREVSDVGVLVGRFQVHKLTEGHRQLMDHVCSQHSKVLIFLGLSPAKCTRRNPLDFEARKQMILEDYPDVNILYIKDEPDDKSWSKRLDAQITDVIGPMSTVSLYGSRESFISHYSGRFSTIQMEQELFVSGTEVRKSITQSTRPTEDFRAGVIWASENQYPRVMPTADILIWNEDRSKILLARKPKETLFRFVGGFADGKSNYEGDARREVLEEASIEISDPVYCLSYVVDDWRYLRESDSIVTLLFEATHVFGKPYPRDDIKELRWFDVEPFDEDVEMVEEHRPLWKKYKEMKGMS